METKIDLTKVDTSFDPSTPVGARAFNPVAYRTALEAWQRLPIEARALFRFAADARPTAHEIAREIAREARRLNSTPPDNWSPEMLLEVK